MKKHVRRLLIALGVYLLLLVLLTLAESRAPASTIRDFEDALWFSIITMTTVGYGDLSPVTPVGRVLGVVFALCSIGILTALIGIGLNLIGDELIPRSKLRRRRNRVWYAFREENEDSAVLAEALRERDPDCMLIFPKGNQLVEAPHCVRLTGGAERLLTLKGSPSGLTMFFMGEDPWENLSLAQEAAELGVEACCRTDASPDPIPDHLHLFSPTEALSRSYWKEHPLRNSEHRIVLIGCGAAGSAILERAILTNVTDPERIVEYDVFGDRAGFERLHPEICKALSGGEEDSLLFFEKDWTEELMLLLEADRIILCTDEDGENRRISEQLEKWFPVRAEIHVLLRDGREENRCFGGRKEIFTPENVLKDELNRRAVLLNEIYNENAASPTAWKDLTPFLRQSNIAAADHLIVKARYLLGEEELTELTAEDCRRAWERYRAIADTEAECLQKMEHRRWMRFHQLYNWKYAPARDNAARLHPMILPYEDLDPVDRRKDSFAWEMLGRIGEKDR